MIVLVQIYKNQQQFVCACESVYGIKSGALYKWSGVWMKWMWHSIGEDTWNSPVIEKN